MYHECFRALDNSGADQKKKKKKSCGGEGGGTLKRPMRNIHKGLKFYNFTGVFKNFRGWLSWPASMVEITVIVEENDKGYHDFLRFACKRYLKGKTRTTTRSKDFLRFRSKAY